MSTYVPSWADIKAGWSAGWKTLAERATSAYGAAAQTDPTGTLQRVQGFVSALADSRTALDRMSAKLPNPPVTDADRAAVAQHQALERRYHELAAGFYADAQPTPAQPPSTGAAPAVLVVAGVAVGVVGLAWAVAAYEYAVNLREQTALAERELDARVEASRQGRTLQSTTLPPQPDPIASAAGAATTAARGVGLLVVGGLVVAAGAFLLPPLLKK